MHRDLKPENVLLDGEGHIRLTDFGLSKERINDENLTYSFCGTPEYLAPEILRKVGHGKPSDWWSLGALLYEMMTGMPPFYSRDRDRLFEKILHSKIKFPTHFSEACCHLLMSLMQRDPNHRLEKYFHEHVAIIKTTGTFDDAKPVKAHVFFRGIDWDLLLNKKVSPPFVPKIEQDTTGCVGVNNFDKEFVDMPIDSPEDNKNPKRISDKKASLLFFEDFTFVREQEVCMNDAKNETNSDNTSESDSDSSTDSGQAEDNNIGVYPLADDTTMSGQNNQFGGSIGEYNNQFRAEDYAQHAVAKTTNKNEEEKKCVSHCLLLIVFSLAKYYQN
ncbi:RAC-beta serine/threonine-protein kinase-A [Reticulomyxa filosa]|uniref:RAC-beta serine/threonine-protein kinase-A n=1 Tax=Reticulomyxa filosa TaxID=46433 RepID=X6M6X1_RETFI|nr:RAC-beta serine/threonine-protein kinase-A [Reticulomyxa filosa]|eukprot:ETO08775.1 RAC-beta serine/threonine-protein kinase-A [Reticulomyxa filosa]